jgi:Txe/YoeB family toxin of Txe-Axe toxin-antitoxin module
MSESKVTKEWRIFHNENPKVYKRLVQLSRELKKSGQPFYSIAGLFEVLRFEYALKTTGIEFKLQNNFKPYYSRLVMTKHRDLRDFFKIRMSMADEVDFLDERL